MSDFCALTISEAKEKLENKEFTSIELTNAYLNRIKKHDKDINAFISVTEELALQMAKSADEKIQKGEKGDLLGIPLAIKDLINVKGIPSTCASKILTNFVSPFDATVTKKVKDSGAVILGKLNMDEFAMGSSNETSYYGNVKNPWDKERVPGGSSGGAAAALPAQFAAGTLGSDTGGSIRQPAALCGCVGLKPTYGRVSRFGMIAFASSLDQIGPFAKDVKDAALLLQVISGKDSFDATSADIPVDNYYDSLEQDIKGMKIGVPKEYFIDGLDPEVEKSIHNAIDVYKSLGAEIIDISLPNTKYAVPTYYVIAPSEASSNLARFDGVRYGYRSENSHDLHEMYFNTKSEGFGAEVKRRIMIGTFCLSSGYYDAYYLKAQKVRTLIKKDFDDAFQQCDVIATPTSPTTAFKFGEKMSDPMSMYLSDIFTISANLTGIPGMSIPCGFSGNNLPIGLQLLGKSFDELTLLRAAHQFQINTGFHKQFPSL
ncbi:MAG: Asp-tRNA(Asn)/Glu-tRNA(Gln) amidotransferase subunit GatA [Nitrospinae bacterium]|nr:Asp-tRNA(Asn)/Glu-tRNA(Gln) amidotransferase subunit GatA [Nitrospinota bacterium]